MSAPGPRPLRIASHPPPLTGNPYQHLLYEHLAPFGVEIRDPPHLRAGWLRLRWLWRARRDLDALHLHWPEGLYRHQRGPRWARPPLSWIKLAALGPRLLAARALGYRLVWTVHQVVPHEHAAERLDRTAAHVLGRGCHVLIAHDEQTRADVRAMLGTHVAAKTHIVPHASYVGVYPPGRDRAAVRARLGIADDAFVFLAFGLVRAYKQLGVLLDAFAAAAPHDAVLLIAGAPADEAQAAAVRGAAARDGRVRLLLGHVPDAEVTELFGASDVAVITRARGTSGALLLALSMGLPVIAADAPAYRALLEQGRAGWFFAAGDADSLAGVIAHVAASPTAAAVKGARGRAIATDLRWERVAERTAQLLRGDAGVTRRRRRREHPGAGEAGRGCREADGRADRLPGWQPTEG